MAFDSYKFRKIIKLFKELKKGYSLISYAFLVDLSNILALSIVDFLKATYINSMWTRISNDRKDVFIV